ncbi:MAG TPA: tRNA pseudouridine(38-40) synthase TruA [Candidatus Cloacimonadota bacterium]|jgi:tRNA pseudouridine38-40 synthase|nr:tRNA pseudouridine(38-40) synthase TruA [Candidatus Cloacimonadales bacterium]HPY97417.1 tRNA pseudouridine(38-40) synthase TruA [Candidatus Cloacimonadota bacterium]HQB41792.1 tRNA pseudouridine(38-40) synthase TruA [Candidatus Cloacimonadota bacterium]
MIFKRIALQIAYDGSQFYGWQKQYISPTVQEVLEQALEKIFKVQTCLTGSGRTDSGVHALCQIAHFEHSVNMNTEQLKLALVTKIPHSVKILNAWEVDKAFHARYSATKRHYTYLISKEYTPFQRLYQANLYKYKINAERIAEAIPYFIGENDFTSFCKPNPEVNNHICRIDSLSIEETTDCYVIKISANRFLHNMVRRIVGALVMVSHRNHSPEIISKWINDKKHEQKNFFTAPASGLYLTEVEYNKEIFPYDIKNLKIY